MAHESSFAGRKMGGPNTPQWAENGTLVWLNVVSWSLMGR